MAKDKTTTKKKKIYKTSMAIRVDRCMWCCVCQRTTFSFIKEYKLQAKGKNGSVTIFLTVNLDIWLRLLSKQ